jgi:hypothetical protein
VSECEHECVMIEYRPTTPSPPRAGPTFSTLTRFIKKISATFISLKRYIMKVYSMIYFMVLIIYHKC